ncbi:MAG TPA: TetR/AcrR family transcriptional regulator [Candidatus Sulfotelmatobacter sp.]|nr:TetR/AcrR family transcriptional regulator [Candidatus Sulfotelmatobacter sp.]
MRYQPEHKVEIHRKILKDASRRVRAEGITGVAVSSVMRDAGLTHGGFYKHFSSKDELLAESLGEAFREVADRLGRAAKKSRPTTEWKAIVKAYLSPEHCDHAECGCPLAALASELGRADHALKAPIREGLIKYKDRMLPLMPGRRVADKERAFFAIFSTMIGAVAIARILPDQAARASVLASARDFLLRSF